jgi:uncharacterized protein YabE (DUF348 family)
MIGTSPQHTEWPPPRPKLPDDPGVLDGTVTDDIEIIPDDPVDAGPESRGGYRGSGRPSGPARQIGIVLAALLLAAVTVVGVVSYLSGSVAVELSVDGEIQTIDTRADTVADLLADQEITVTPDDLVVPSPDTELSDGTVVEVRFARPLTLTVDGVDTVHTTTELTVGQALAAVTAPVDGSAVSLALDQPLPRGGADVDIVTPKAITIDVAGQSRTVTTTARSVADLLADEGITVAELDTVAPAVDTTVTADLVVTVTRIRTESEVRTEPIGHATEERQDAELTVGTRQVATAGVDGSKQVTYSVTYTNDRVTAEEPVSEVVVTEPVTEVIRVGTKPAPVVQPGPAAGGSGGGAAGSLNWAALANCESSGNPRAVNPAGYYGLYQFSLPTWRSVGGTGNPADASPAEQTERAQILYNRSGAGQWPSCGRLLFT